MYYELPIGSNIYVVRKVDASVTQALGSGVIY